MALKVKFLYAAVLFTLCEALFLFNLHFPTSLNFDETHYVPAAKNLITLTEIVNREHPPLAKWLIGAGIAMAGDTPEGWRVMSTVFGALLVVAVFFWAFELFGQRVGPACLAAGLTVFNFMTYVQSRIAMLDTFMTTFIFGAIAIAAYARRSGSVRAVYGAGVCAGLAVACKWAAAPVVPLLFVLLGARFSWRKLLLPVGLASVATYFLSFVPYLLTKSESFSWLSILTSPYDMLKLQLRVGNTHPYLSDWTSWPFMSRPIWYAFDKDPTGQFVRGVLCLANPIVQWLGLGALVYGVGRWADARFREGVLTWAAFFVMFVVFPKRVSFFYYYYPCVIALGILLVACVDALPTSRLRVGVGLGLLAVSAGLFVHFFPVLGAFEIPAESFTRWMWLRSWI